LFFGPIPCSGTAQTKVKIGEEEEGQAAIEMDDSECMIIVRFGAVSKSITLSVHRTSCDRLRILVEKVLEHHLPAASPRLRMVVDGREVPDGIKSLAEVGLGLSKVMLVAELIANID